MFQNEKLHPKKTTDVLKLSNPKTPKYYATPNIYKLNNPGRTVRHKSVTYQKFQDSLIRISIIIKEISKRSFFNKANSVSVPVNSVLAGMDVKSL